MEVPDSVRQVLERAALSVPGEIVQIPSVENGFFIPVGVTRGSDGRQRPPEAALTQAGEEIAALGFRAEFLLVDERSIDAEESLRTSLAAKFSPLVKDAFLSVERTKSNVWLSTHMPLEPEELEEITTHANQVSELFNLPPARIILLGAINTPTKLEILKVARRIAPVDCDRLKSALEKRGYDVPSLEWINKQFDLLRKNGFLVRMHNGTYGLTADGLTKMGTVKGRLSPDIDRLLALARGQI